MLRDFASFHQKKKKSCDYVPRWVSTNLTAVIISQYIWPSILMDLANCGLKYQKNKLKFPKSKT